MRISALMGKKASAVAGVVAISLLFGLPLFFELGSDDLQSDEAVYSYVVDRVLEHGNWLALDFIPSTHPGADPEPSVYVEKPPFKLWTVAFAIKIGLLPHNEFGLRFWDALFGAVAFVYVFLIGRRLVDPVCGFAAVFLLFTHPELLDSHGLRSNVMEAALVVGYSGGSITSLPGATAAGPRVGGDTSSPSWGGSRSRSWQKVSRPSSCRRSLASPPCRLRSGEDACGSMRGVGLSERWERWS